MEGAEQTVARGGLAIASAVGEQIPTTHYMLVKLITTILWYALFCSIIERIHTKFICRALEMYSFRSS